MNKIVIIGTCDSCPFFDNQYYGYNEICKCLDRKIDSVDGEHPIPDDCPLETTEQTTS